MKQYKPQDKVTQKMTREGAINENQATGETEHISQREKPADFSGRLHFTEEDRARPELERYIRKSEKAADQAEAARENIPKKKKLTRQRVYDEAAGKGKTKLRFEEAEKSPSELSKSNPLMGSAAFSGRLAAGKLHGKVHEVEKDNAGVEAGHSVERAGEKTFSISSRITRTAIRNHRMKPYREAQKAEQALHKANVDFLYHKTLTDNPQAAGNPVSRFLQKRQIRKNYAKELRNAEKTAKKTGQAAKTAGKKTAQAGGKIAEFVAKHWKGTLIVVAIGLLIMVLAGGISSCSNMFLGGLSAITATTYPSEENDMTAVEGAYTAKEQDLQYELDNYESLHPGYDEYRYHLDGIYHDPHELAAYLSAYFGGSYTLASAQAQLQVIFDAQYELTETETEEIRYRTETRTDTWTDEDGNTHTDTYEVEVPYTYYIMTVTLKNNGIFHVAESTLDTEQLEMYHAYRDTSGNMPLLFGGGSFDTSPSTDLSGVEFVNGTRPGNEAIIELAKAQVGNVGGQPYWSWYGFNSRVEWCACFVSWCIKQAGYSEPRFAACASQGVPWFKEHGQWAAGNYTDVAPGDVIFFDWDGGGADHVGLVIGTDGTNVYTVEGNSGDACKIKSYPLTSQYIHGYGLMNW